MNYEFLSNHPELKLSYHVEGRNGYYGVDEYLNENGSSDTGCTRDVEAFKTRKLADSVCSEMQALADVINRLRGLDV